MKPPVGPRQPGRIAKEGTVVLNHIPQNADLLCRGVAGGQTGGQRLKLGPDNVKLRQLIVVEGGDDQRPSVPRQKRLRLKPLQCLTDRRARHAETIRQLTFHQPVSGFENPFVNRFEDQRIRVFLHRNLSPPARDRATVAAPVRPRKAPPLAPIVAAP